MTNFNNNSLIHTAIGATLVITGVVIKNTFEQLNMKDDIVGKIFGIGSFLLGWIWVAWALGNGRKHPWIFWLASASVFVTVMIMKSIMAKGKTPNPVFPVIFALSWLVLGLFVSEHLPGALRWVGLTAPVLVLLSMMASLPWQRKQCVVDGPGAYFFAYGWAVMILANSLNR